MSEQPTSDEPVSVPSADSGPAPENTRDTSRSHKPKITAVGSFRKLWKRKTSTPSAEWPPKHWSESEDPQVAAAARVPLPATPAVERGLPTITEPTPTTATSDETATAAPAAPKTPEPDDFPPQTLAGRIRDLLSSYILEDKPLPSPPPPVDGQGSQPPPPPPSDIDKTLARLLSSVAVMNGSITRGRKSVWDMLDRMHAPKLPNLTSGESRVPKDDKGKGKEEGDASSVESEDDDDDADSSVMFYGPLVPATDSEVELARRETVRLDKEGHIVQTTVPSSGAGSGLPETEQGSHEVGSHKVEAQHGGPRDKRRKSWWPFNKKSGEIGDGKLKKRRVWVPSTTQLSVQTMWWGYRLYLPPPVMVILDARSVETAKQAAMITTGLTWILNKLPVKLFPPQLRPAVMLAKRLVPFAGYIGAGIAWSWSTIKTFDKGNGVTLTATWLLPVALIPGIWEDEDVPKPEPSTNFPQHLAEDNPAEGHASATHTPETAL